MTDLKNLIQVLIVYHLFNIKTHVSSHNVTSVLLHEPFKEKKLALIER